MQQKAALDVTLATQEKEAALARSEMDARNQTALAVHNQKETDFLHSAYADSKAKVEDLSTQLSEQKKVWQMKLQAERAKEQARPEP